MMTILLIRWAFAVAVVVAVVVVVVVVVALFHFTTCVYAQYRHTGKLAVTRATLHSCRYITLYIELTQRGIAL